MIANWLGKNQNIDPMWKVLNEEVDLGEPTSFLDHVYLGCTQRECETSKDIVGNHRNMFGSRISAGAKEKLPCSGKLDTDISSWFYDMEGHAKKCVERYCQLTNRTPQQVYKVTTPCLDDQHSKEKALGSVGELSKVCSQIVLKCLYLARIGRPDILWSVNKVARFNPVRCFTFLKSNEAVIKMIILGRRPTMRHVSRTRRVALDWLFDRINLGPKIQLKYVNTKIQLADIMTKGNFTRDEWNNLFQCQHFQLSQLPRSDVEKNATGNWRRRELWQSRKPTLNSSASSRLGLLRAPSQQGSNLIAQCAGKPAAGGFKSKWRSVKFSSVANRCKDDRNCEETRCSRHELGSEFSRKCKETCRWKFGN